MTEQRETGRRVDPAAPQPRDEGANAESDTLEELEDDRVDAIVGNTVNVWVRASAHLARLYRKSAQEDKARAIEAHLLKLLGAADADHPLGAELTRRR